MPLNQPKERVMELLGPYKDSMDQIIIKYIQNSVELWLNSNDFEKQELFDNLNSLFIDMEFSKDFIQNYLCSLDNLKSLFIQESHDSTSNNHSNDPINENYKLFKNEKYNSSQSVVPLECPIQMGLSPITIQMMDVPKNVQIDWLATRKTVTSQVDYARLERIQQRKKNREEKSLLKGNSKSSSSSFPSTSSFIHGKIGNNGSSHNLSSFHSTFHSSLPSFFNSISSKEIVDKLLMEKKSGKLNITLSNFDISLDGRRILTDASIVISTGSIPFNPSSHQGGNSHETGNINNLNGGGKRRYGLVGRNGIGKSTFLKHLSHRQLKGIPDSISILAVEQEAVSLNLSVLQAVLQTDWRRKALLEASQSSNIDSDRLREIYDKLEEIDADTAESRASIILSGLGFSIPDQSRLVEEFSGGWRMRVALASALFFQPDLLLLDEPTNMLDFPTVIWLQNYLCSIKSTVIIVSHDKFFLDSSATDIIHMHHEQLVLYSGSNYSQFKRVREEREKNQQREYESQLLHRQHLQDFIDRWRYNASKAQLAQSRIKILEKLPDLKPVIQDAMIAFKFPSCEQLSPPIVELDELSFGYEGSLKMIFENVNFNIQLNSRIAIVGPNGAGKSTLLKLIMGELNLVSHDYDLLMKSFKSSPSIQSNENENEKEMIDSDKNHEKSNLESKEKIETKEERREKSKGHGKGNIYRNPRLRIGYFSQHHVEQLDMTKTSLQILAALNPSLNDEEVRHHLGAFGITGPLALQRISTLSGGQKSRVSFAIIASNRPHIMILDEPTNHLDMDSIDALIKALKEWDGGVVCVSHDKNFISCLCQEIWVCNNERLEKYQGTSIHDYANSLLQENMIK